MKVKIDDKIYDINNKPIMINIIEEEKEHIFKMEGRLYPFYPEDEKYSHEYIRKWLLHGGVTNV